MHWLSSVPATITNHIWPNRATGAAKEAFARQSREDWKHLLEHRQHELKARGRVLGGASDEHGNSDAEAFAAAYTDFFRAAFGPSIFGALDPARASKEHPHLAPSGTPGGFCDGMAAF